MSVTNIIIIVIMCVLLAAFFNERPMRCYFGFHKFAPLKRQNQDWGQEQEKHYCELCHDIKNINNLKKEKNGR